MQRIHTFLNVMAAFGAYIYNALVTYYFGNLTDDDWNALKKHLSSEHRLKYTIYLTYTTNALVFINPHVKNFINFCGSDNAECRGWCKVRVSSLYIVEVN